ncbi:DoxX family membrane protein [Streptomyces tsukubensis]|uniref:DoxX family membrane protein n=1 Tax=Streptomyces tsukubensis TaxID=83656 RepID=A0A1V4A8Q8_9ACTN|nr:hypothetical protein B1H18_15620 [Streptomyces tsukubensis]QFR97788.1 DoxX family membrane protein [Streptomyces tsukubensis]
MDTRTPRNPTGGSSSGYDDVPALSMVKVASDPAQVIVNHASFRVQLPTSQPRFQRVVRRPPADAAPAGALDQTARVPVATPAARRRAPVVWSGRSAPGDSGATTGLLQAVRTTGVRHGQRPGGPGTGYDEGATQAIPLIGQDGPHAEAGSTVESPAVRPPGTRLLPQMRSSGSAYEEETRYGARPTGPYEESSYERSGRFGDESDQLVEVDGEQEPGGDDATARRSGDSVRHAYYPGRRMNLGVVLLPLRVFLGLISVYAGLGKLCDPVYFDGGERGSMVKWLNSLHPWALAEPLRDFALSHPVGAGLTVAFLQVVAGVLTVLGLWQRVAAALGVLLSTALIVTVSWKTVPAYDAPDIIYLAAWSPLIIAGAPVYSVDGRLAGEAWRKLGPRASLKALRRRVLRRGMVVATVVVGLTLLVGSVLGGAVRDADRVTVPGPGQAPRNQLPGSPLPQEPGKRGKPENGRSPSASTGTPTQGQEGGSTAGPSAPATPPGRTTGETSGSTSTGEGRPSETQGTVGGGAPQQQQQPPPRQQAPAQQPPATGGGPTSSGGSATGGSGTQDSPGSGSSTGGGSGSDGGGSSLVGGLLG